MTGAGCFVLKERWLVERLALLDFCAGRRGRATGQSLNKKHLLADHCIASRDSKYQAGLGTRLSSELLDPVMGGTVMSIRLSSIAASYSVWTKVQIRIFQSLSPDYGDCVYEAAGSGSLDHRLRSGGGKVFANIRLLPLD